MKNDKVELIDKILEDNNIGLETLNIYLETKHSLLCVPTYKWKAVTDKLYECIGDAEWKDEYDL